MHNNVKMCKKKLSASKKCIQVKNFFFFFYKSHEVQSIFKHAILFSACYKFALQTGWWGTEDISSLCLSNLCAERSTAMDESAVWECRQAPWCPLRSIQTPISSSSQHTTTGLVTRRWGWGVEGEKAAPAFHSLRHQSRYCTQAFSQDIQHPGKGGILLRIPLSSLREPKLGQKSLLGAFQRGRSPDTTALCTSQAGQRPLSRRLHISALTGLLCFCQPDEHNTQCAHGRPLPSLFPPKSTLKELHSLITALQREARHCFKTLGRHPLEWGVSQNPKLSSNRLVGGQSKVKRVDKAVIKPLKLQSSQNI